MFPKVKKSDRCQPEYRSILAFILRAEPSARKAYAHLLRCGARNIRPDYMLRRNAEGTYDRIPDLGAWNCYVSAFGGMTLAMIRHGENDWVLHS